MILAKIVLTICGIAMLLMGISTIVLPDVNSFFIPFEVSDKSTATLVRTYGDQQCGLSSLLLLRGFRVP